MAPPSRITSALALAGLAAVVASALTPAAASAQFNFATRGYFSSPFVGCNQGLGGASMVVTCTGGGLTLTFTGLASAAAAYPSGATASLGTFEITGLANVTLPPATVQFTLLLDQIAPTPGTGVFSGPIAGTVSTIPRATSSLVWQPNELDIVGPVTYDLVFDLAFGGVAIPPSGTAPVDAVGTLPSATVPEPATVALVGFGLLGLGGTVTRRARRPA
jgi:hypothetical protein